MFKNHDVSWIKLNNKQIHYEEINTVEIKKGRFTKWDVTFYGEIFTKFKITENVYKSPCKQNYITEQTNYLLRNY